MIPGSRCKVLRKSVLYCELDASRFIFLSKVSPERPMSLPLPPWAFQRNRNGDGDSRSVQRTDPQYPPRPSAPRRIGDIAEPHASERTTHSFPSATSRKQPILIKLLESTKVSQPLTFLEPKNSSEQHRLPPPSSRTELPAQTLAIQRRLSAPDSGLRRLRYTPVVAAVRRPTRSSGSRPQPQAEQRPCADSWELQIRREPRSTRTSKQRSSDALVSQRFRASERLLGMPMVHTSFDATPLQSASSLSRNSTELPKTLVSPNPAILARGGDLVPISTPSRPSRSLNGNESQCFMEFSRAVTSPGHSAVSSQGGRWPEEAHHSGELRRAPEPQSPDPEHLPRSGRTAATIFPSGPAHSTRITYTMAPSNNSPTQHQSISQQTQFLSTSSFTPPFFPGAQYSPRLSQSVEVLYPAGQSSNSPQQLPLAYPPRSREVVYLTGHPQATEMTKVVHIRYPDTLNQSQFSTQPGCLAYPDPRLQVLVQPNQSVSPYANQAPQQPRVINLMSQANFQYHEQMQYSSPPPHYMMGGQQSPNLSVHQFPIASPRRSDPSSPAQLFVDQSVSQPTMLPHQMRYLN